MVRHNETPGIVRTEQFVQAYSGTFTTYSDLSRDIKAYSVIIEAY